MHQYSIYFQNSTTAVTKARGRLECTYTGQVNALGLAHGVGILRQGHHYTLTGVFNDGAMSFGLYDINTKYHSGRAGSEWKTYTSFDESGHQHGACVSLECGVIEVVIVHHGIRQYDTTGFYYSSINLILHIKPFNNDDNFE
jgi:hypothetical protein